ncbi:MAG: Na/Pi symporter [Clostridiales bacterium]|nr:Na/Pi symporter [Candidatus Apopatocola equi]
MLGGLSLFLFGMSLMGQSLERRSGGRLQGLPERMTTGRSAGLLTGLGVTAVIQSSSATTVMVVGFVNSGLMTLRQAGFVWSDILTDLERVSDHCSNIAGCVTDMAEHNLNVHSSLRELRHGSEKFDELFRYYGKKYSVSR